MNILLTSVGRRAYMVKYFKKAIAPKGKVHVCNSDDKTIAFHYADASIVAPLIYSDEYIPFLLKYCKDNDINLVLSLFDIDLPILAKNRDRFEGIGVKLIVSPEEFVNICNDKWLTYQYLLKNDFNVPKTYIKLEEVLLALKSGELQFPLIMKPRFGCGSIALSIVDDLEELHYLYNKNLRLINNCYLRYESIQVEDKLIFQEYLNGQEYGCDIINNLDGEFINAIIKKKIAMRAGETDIAETVDEPVLMEYASKLGELTGHVANLDCDMYLVGGKPYILEMNARFGGGYPFSHTAGCNLPKAIVDWCKGKKVDKSMLSARTGVKAFKELYLTKI